ncbi:SAICAR synthase-like protein, partial [Clavulina sp. PMI_390]
METTTSPTSLSAPPRPAPDTASPAPSSQQEEVPARFSAQVGGHGGVLSSADGSLLIKPAAPTEKAFYDALASSLPGQTDTDDNPELSAFEPLRKWVPTFYGTLRLEGRVVPVDGSMNSNAGNLMGDGTSGSGQESLVLANAAHPFTRPNVLDIKLGTVLYDESATEEKKKRMEKQARETTSAETGMRLTGFQVWNAATNIYDVTPKAYGKSIRPAELPQGMAKFFSVSISSGSGSVPAQTSAGVRPDLLIPVVKGVLDLVSELRADVAATMMRMAGGSVLILWEGDEGALEAALDASVEARLRRLASGEEEEVENGVEDEDEDEDSEASGGDGRPGPPYIVRLIDFAHTRAVESDQGPDEGVLKGLDTAIGLLRGRLAELE